MQPIWDSDGDDNAQVPYNRLAQVAGKPDFIQNFVLKVCLEIKTAVYACLQQIYSDSYFLCATTYFRDIHDKML